MTIRAKFRTTLLAFVAAAALAVPVQEAFALITGGVGNSPVGDPGWPKGAAAIFNVSRASPGGRGRPSAADNGTPSVAATPRPSMPSWPTSPSST